MNYGHLLFSPNGEVGPRPFIIGAAILAALLFVIKASAAISVGVGSILSIIGLVLIYCWFALFAKRFRFSGKSAALAIIPVAIIVLVGMFIIDGLVQTMVAPELMEEMTLAVAEAVETEGIMGSLTVAQEYGGRVAEATAVPVGAARAAFSLVIAWLTNLVAGAPRQPI